MWECGLKQPWDIILEYHLNVTPYVGVWIETIFMTLPTTTTKEVAFYMEGAMAAFMDELRDCLADGWTVELGELGYFTPSLNCRREAMEKKELRAASVTLRGLNFRLGKEFYKELDKKMRLERHPQSSSKPESSTPLLSVEQRFRLLDEYLRQEQPCINRAQYARLTGRSVKQAVTDLNLFIEDGLLKRCGAGRNVVYMRNK